MKVVKMAVVTAMALVLSSEAAAQADEEIRRVEALQEQEVARTKALAAEHEKTVHTIEAREVEVQRRLEDAERRMAAAARQIAELTSERLPRSNRISRHFEIIDDGKPRLGVTIGGGDDKGPVEGVSIMAVTPGSAASDSGLRAGDILTAVNDESLSADSAEQAMSMLMDFMSGVEAGDTLDVEYLRNGKVGKVEVEPKPVDIRTFAFNAVPGAPRPPGAASPNVFIEKLGSNFDFNWITDGWGDMELVELSEGLGKYFGTDDGLLVVSAPQGSSFKLEDGDVIQQIDGREPTSVRHALRILGSYQAGESLTLKIMRDKKSRTLDIEMPDDRSSQLEQKFWSVIPSRAPAPPAAPRPPAGDERT